MPELHLQAGDDHVERLAHENDPVRAVVELIWNAIDAEAPVVSVQLEHDDNEGLGAITKTIVSDTGHGIDRDELAFTFGRIGGFGNVWPIRRRTTSVDSTASAEKDGYAHSPSVTG